MVDGKNERLVLIVDDDNDIREVLGEVLAEAGYEVVGAKDGADALRVLRESATLPCIILLDLMMPVMNGYEFRTAQKNDAQLCAIPVILLSAGVRPDADALDVAAILPKPVKIPALLEAVDRYR
jgi:CheY-like chemotaxis protein